jgi:hypothetical protein
MKKVNATNQLRSLFIVSHKDVSTFEK